jgi:hypothetical protein
MKLPLAVSDYMLSQTPVDGVGKTGTRGNYCVCEV